MLRRLSDLVGGRPRRVLVVTLLVVFASVFFGGRVAGLLSDDNSNFEDPASESVVAREALQDAAGSSPEVAVVALVRTGVDIRTSRGARAEVEGVADTIAADPAVAHVVGYLETQNPAFISRDGTSTYLAASFEPVSDEEQADAAQRIEKALAGNDAVTLGGDVVASSQVGDQVGTDLAKAELLAFPILLLISLFVFRGVVAALLPLLTGATSIIVTFLALRLTNEVTSLSIFALNLVTGLGLGLAIDYSLFIVSRYREELAKVGPGREALRNTLATAGRTVAFSALTVAVALAGLLVFPQKFLYSMGIGGIFVALISAASALIVLPAVLALLGPRVNSLSFGRWKESADRIARGEKSGFWYGLAQWVMRRARRVAIVCTVLLIALGIPFWGVKFTGVDASVLPESAGARQVSDALEQEFPSQQTSPVYLAIDAPASATWGIERYAGRLAELPGVAAVSAPRSLDDGLWQIDVTSTDRALADSSKDLVRDIRSLDAPYPVDVGGQTAQFLDQQSSLASNIPLALAILGVGTFLILFTMTGSVVLPVKALLMNLLSLSAAFGIVTLIFQNGNLEGLLGFTSQGALEMTQPILLFAVAFALSTDYAVFLLTRIKEARDSGMSNTESVATGLERTGRIVTAAALLFCIAIGAFSTSEIVFIKMLGVGTALAVIIDATIVRALLVPALMKLLGEWNWWAPKPLRRLHERFAPQAA
jgi:uncharacterized membrane protein YdfJ with MMPL/SSD domain